jgi:hypothetical protein
MNVFKVLVYLLFFVATPYLIGQEFEIHLTRPAQVGEKYEVTALGSRSSQMNMSRRGQVLQKNISSLSAKLEGLFTVLEIDQKKQATKASMVVSRCVVSREGKKDEEEVVPRGTRILLQQQQGETIAIINEKRAPERVTEILDILISLNRGDTDNDIMGTNERKKVGDTWPMNNIKAAAALSTSIATALPKNIKGVAMLESTVEVEGINCLRVKGNIEISGVTPPLPVGMDIVKSNITAILSGDFPIDRRINRLSEEMSMTMLIEAKGKPGLEYSDVTMSLKSLESSHAKFRLIRPQK